MIRICLNCNAERDTTSKRSAFYCSAPKCQWQANRKPKVKREPGERFRWYGVRTNRLKRLWRKRGETTHVHGV